MAWELNINGVSRMVATPEELRGSLEQERAQRFLEVWLERDDGDGVDHGSMALLASGDRAWLMHLRHHDGDSGFSSRDPDYAGREDAVLPFMLSNGQEDEYPVAWTIARDEAYRALEHFMVTGERAPWVTWHED